MPVTIGGLSDIQARRANAAMAHAYFPRAKDWLYPSICGSVTSTSLVEPFAVLGAAPGLKKYVNGLKKRGIRTYASNIPNTLFKNIVPIPQTSLEGDQTGTVVQLSAQVGVRLAEFPDQLFCQRLVTGSTAAKAVERFEDGIDYNLTLDGVSFYNTAHPNGNGVASNIVQGHLPNTSAALLAQDPEVTAKQLQKDLAKVLEAVRNAKDDQGINIYPNIKASANICVVVGSALETAAQLAFRTPGGVIDQTTNIFPTLVKDVKVSGYLDGFPDLTKDDGASVDPLNETDWYIMIDDDFVKPLYAQLYRPISGSEVVDGLDEAVDAIINKVNGATVDQATLFASTRVDTTFNKVGNNADAFTIENEEFLVSARWRGNFFYGPWFTSWRIIPVGGTDND